MLLLLALLKTSSQPDQLSDQSIQVRKEVNAGIAEVWRAWTTKEGIVSFLAPDCNIEFRVGGAYEMFFNPTAKPGQKGGEGVKILAIEPEKMLSFTWNAPPSLPDVRKQWTHVTVRFTALSDSKTLVSLTHDGWGEGEEWQKAFQYFSSAWRDVVFPRLNYRFENGPVDWENLPKFKSSQ
jgi:uncharacterized protein YndB with AHSA1/START domain